MNRPLRRPVGELREAPVPDAQDPGLRVLALVDGLLAELHAGGRLRAAMDSAFDRDLGLDSLARVELLARIERAFGVHLPEDALEMVATPRELVAALARGTTGAGGPDALGAREASPAATAGRPESARDLVEVLDWHAERHPERVHVSYYRTPDETDSLSYGSLHEAADSVGAGLRALGVQEGARVAIMLPSGLDFFRCFFGVLRAGAIPVPLYPPARPAQLEEHLRRQAGILRNCEASHLVAFEAVRPLARLMTGLAPALERVLMPGDLSGLAGEGGAPAVAGDMGLIQYTSGSTGDPKGVVLTHANLLSNIRAFGQVLQADSTDVCVSWLPLYHDMGLIGAWLGSLYYGCPLVLLSPQDFLMRPERWLWAIHRHRGTITAAPNFAYELCLKRTADEQLQGLDLSSLRAALNGAEPVSPDTLERFVERFAGYGLGPEVFLPVYGLAECSVALCVPPPGRGARVDRIERERFERTGEARAGDSGDGGALRFVSCGRPLPGHEVRIVDGAGRPLPERRVGLLEFRGPSATAGYYRNERATSALLRDGWLASGDYAYLADGEVHVSGRAKEMIVRAGRNFYPYELEQAVGTLPGVRKGCVAAFGVHEPGAEGERLVVVAETQERDEAARGALERRIVALASDLLGLPPDVVVLAPPHAVLKTSSGKIRRAEIRERFRRGTLGTGSRAAWLQVLRLGALSTAGRLRRGAQTLKRVPYAAWLWGWAALLSAVGMLAILTLPTLESRWRACHRLARLLMRLCGLRLAVRGLHKLPREGCIFVANHASYIDGFVLAAALPAPVSFVGKAELARSPLLRRLFERMDAHFVERFDARRSVADAQALAEAAQHGPPLFFFAEGTFRREVGLRPFRLGAFQAAAGAGLPVVPVALAGTRDILPADSWMPRRGAVAVTLSAPVVPEGEGWHGVLALRDRVRADIARLCGEPDLETRPGAGARAAARLPS